MTTADLQLPVPINRLRSILREHGIVRAGVFGSYARGEQTPRSDLDLLIKCPPGMSLFDVFDLQAVLERQTGVKVDLVTKINRHFAEYIEADLIDLNI